ncbi:MAG: GIY-YIG nuclease family protein [Candidatus Sungiibacteriota bacterium]
MYYFYLIQSIKRPDAIYSGSTIDLKKRMEEHNQGEVISTKRYLPWRLVYYEAYVSEGDAREREQKFKRHGKGNNELKKRLKRSLTASIKR